jgi:hypothetical protein
MDDRIEPQTSGGAQSEAPAQVPPLPSDATPAPPDNLGWLTTGNEPLRRPPPNLAGLQDGPGPWVPRPPQGPPTWVPDSQSWDVAARIAASRHSLNPALGTVGEVLPPLPLRVLGATAGTAIQHSGTVTRQEQPDHPQSHTWPGVQDQPTAPPTPAEIAAANHKRIADGYRNAALFNLAFVGEGALQAEALVVPDQSPAPVRVEERNGKIALASDRDSPLRSAEADFNAWREPVIDHVREMLAGDFRQGTNHGRARDRLVALGNLLPGSVSEVKERQFHIGYEVERLDGLVAAYRSARDDMPELNAAVLEDLDRLLIALKTGIDKLERWAEFRRSAADDPMREGEANPTVVGEALDEMAAVMEQQSKYFDSHLPATFRFLAEAVRDPVGATRTVVCGAVTSAENLISFLGRRALGIATKTADEVEQRLPKTLARGLIGALAGAALYLSGALPAGWGWLKPLLDAIANAGGN